MLSTPHSHECPAGEIFALNQCWPGNRDTCELDSLEQICQGVFFGARPYPNDNTGKVYVGCIKGIGTLESCHENEIFDVEHNRCEVPRDFDNPCQNHPGQVIVDPNDCSQFIVCAILIPRHYSCPARMIFDEEQRRCVVGSSDVCAVTDVEDICRGIFFEAFPHPHNDLMFVGCQRNEHTVRHCPEQTRYESMIGECI